MINYEIAKKNLESGNAKDFTFFALNGYLLEYGYSLILMGQLEKAKEVLSQVDSLRSKWAISFIPFMAGHVEKMPSYFQIRNFFEIDVNLLLKSNQIDFVSYILGGADILYSINSEVYKYIARVMMNNRYWDISKTYLDKGQELTENDPELFFMLCQYYISLSEFAKALYSIENCLRILPEYYPAIKIKEALLNQ